MCADINVLCLCRIADPDQPVLWLDQMPARSLSRGFNNHINLIRYESFTKQPSPRTLRDCTKTYQPLMKQHITVLIVHVLSVLP